MKTLPLFLSAVLAVNASAFWGGSPKEDGSAALAKLFGQNNAFSATADISSKTRAGRDEHASSMNYAFLEGKLRTEIDMTKTKAAEKHAEGMGMAASMGMGQMVMLVRPDKKASYVIYPGLKAYCEMPLKKANGDDAGKPPKIERTDLGKETIDGHPCTKQKVVITDDDGKQQEMVVWSATDLKDFPIKSEMQTAGDTITTTFHNVKLSKPDAAQFELPAEYKKYDSMQDMMMQSMQRMMGGQ